MQLEEHNAYIRTYALVKDVTFYLTKTSSGRKIATTIDTLVSETRKFSIHQLVEEGSPLINELPRHKQRGILK